MSWITITWPMVAGACLTLGLIELSIGVSQPPRAPRLMFALSAFAVALIAGLELALTRVDTMVEWWPVMRWLDIAVGVMIASITAFVWVFFGTGNKWLALSVPSLYAVGLMFDYLPGSGMTYQRVTDFKTVEMFGGATFNVAVGEPNPWNVFPYLAVLMLIVFVLDASVRLWRRGDRRRAAVVGGAIVFFFLAAGGHTALLETGFVETPYLISWAYLAILVAIASELHADVLAAAQLSLHLQESERRMDLVGAAAQLGTWSWDISRDRISASNQARSLLGLSTPELLGVEHFLSTTHQADRQVVERTMREAGAMNSGSDFEYRVQRRNGDVRWIATRVWPDIARDRRLLGVAIDVTERKAAELQAARDRAELRHMTRVSMLGQLSAYIAHELNQPLAAILGNAEAAQAMLERDEVDLIELRAICDDIVSEDHRASRIIQRLRDLFRRGDSKLEPLALNAIVGETLDLIHKELLSRNVMVATELASTLPVIEGDKVQLQQVLLNLIMNAADAMRDTALELRKLAIRTEMTVADVQLYVVDHGPGISEDDLKRVFDPFWTTKSGGMGIGLAICKSIVEAHRGTIVAANGEDGGASFCVTFPVRTLA